MMVDIAKRPGADPVTLRQISETTEISKPYLDQVAVGLKTSALIRSMRGRGGGYQLTRPADEISVRQIIEAAIGPINVVDCALRPETCGRSDCCECRWVYQRINDEVTNLLNGMTLDELAGKRADAPGRGELGGTAPGTGRPSNLE
jgi:Rrf2 family iron-sulfur cluster assembly transcriptional regulator